MGWFVDLNFKISRAFDRLLPAEMSVEGSQEYRRKLLPSILKPNSVVWDIGSGRYPMVSAALKSSLGVRVTGLDLDKTELLAAPAGAYDHIVVADATTYSGSGDADLVVSHCCFEHLPDCAGAFGSVASMLRPGALAAIYQPSGNAVFAKLNLLLPEEVKRRLLRMLGANSGRGGWPAVYDRCTPAQFADLARGARLEVVDLRVFWISGYFMFFFPLHVAWRVWMLMARAIVGDQAAESFYIIVRKPDVQSN